MPNKWVEHVKRWSAENNMTYGCAVSKPECREAYHKKNLTKKYEKEQQPKEMEQMGKEDINRAKKPEKKKGHSFVFEGDRLKLSLKDINGKKYLVSEVDKFGNEIVFNTKKEFVGIIKDNELYEKVDTTKKEGIEIFGKNAAEVYDEYDMFTEEKAPAKKPAAKAPAKKPAAKAPAEKGTAAQKVFDIPALKDYIEGYVPKKNSVKIRLANKTPEERDFYQYQVTTLGRSWAREVFGEDNRYRQKVVEMINNLFEEDDIKYLAIKPANISEKKFINLLESDGLTKYLTIYNTRYENGKKNWDYAAADEENRLLDFLELAKKEKLIVFNYFDSTEIERSLK